MRRIVTVLVAALGLPAAGCVSVSVVEEQPVRPAAVQDTADWQAAEAGVLGHHVQLTFADRFVRAGEAYFSPDDSMIVFQAVEVPTDGGEPDEFYAMFVADVVRDDAGHVAGIDGIRRISPPGSANTCGWFHPTEPGVVLFASTVDPPSESGRPGYQRDNRRYKWMFPSEMRIVRVRLDRADGTAASLEPVVGDDAAYQAEGVVSADGRHLVFCSLESGRGDLFVKDLESGAVTRVVQSEAYDGGPFFSPDGRRLCYRSDRRKEHYLQILVGELAVSGDGAVVGLEREHQLTDNEHVNWCPFWHPSGRALVYATSEVGHHNYEIFMLDADPGDLPGSTGTIRYGTRKRRITHAAGADVLPAFSSDGATMMWTSKRGERETAQLWAASFDLELE
ncbi:MAG: hypothetical protein ACYTG1_13395 [Planctomycetota bacterium]|jgi:hypothetical protein